jgi:hypothetical protein
MIAAGEVHVVEARKVDEPGKFASYVRLRPVGGDG